MLESVISVVLTVGSIYLASGFLFAVLFLIKGLGRVDKNAEQTGFGFKLIILPGLLVFWPVFLKKWRAV